MLRTAFLVGIGPQAIAVVALGEQRMINIGDRRFAVYCDGEPDCWPTVVLITAGGIPLNSVRL